MSIILKKRWRSQPQFAAQIDWGNPITQGLIGCYMGSGADPARNLALPSNRFTPSGSGAAITQTQSGIGYTLDGASYLQDQNFPEVVVETGRTMLALVNPASLPASNANVITWTSINDVLNIEQLSITSTGVVRAETYRNGSAGPAVTSGTVTLNKWQMIGAIMSAGDLSRSACLETEISTFANPSVALLWPANWLTMGYAPWAGVDYFTGGIALALVWGRGIADTEYLSIVKNPWQVFAPIQRRILVPAAVAATGTFGPIVNGGTLTRGLVRGGRLVA
jgi:hypothetical protein